MPDIPRRWLKRDVGKHSAPLLTEAERNSMGKVLLEEGLIRVFLREPFHFVAPCAPNELGKSEDAGTGDRSHFGALGHLHPKWKQNDGT